MAIDYYAGWTLENKKKKLLALQEMQSLGPLKVSQTGPGQRSEFEASKMSMEREIMKVMISIAGDEGFDENDPVCAACLAATERPSQTIPVFG